MAFIVGCQTEPPPAPVVNVIVEDKMPVASQPPRKRTAEQIQLLQEFAQKESPEVWRTIQSLRGEMSESARNLKRLRDQLIEFDRNPDLDEDYKALRFGLQDLRRAYDAIYDNLENAYIAAKKFEASPSRRGYQDTMKKAFEDGIQNATIIMDRYRLSNKR
jgi:hypothetical protein